MVVVEDDGKGFDPALLDGSLPDGHLGLRMLNDMVRAAGGDQEVRSVPRQGIRVRMEIPTT